MFLFCYDCRWFCLHVVGPITQKNLTDFFKLESQFVTGNRRKTELCLGFFRPKLTLNTPEQWNKLKIETFQISTLVVLPQWHFLYIASQPVLSAPFSRTDNSNYIQSSWSMNVHLSHCCWCIAHETNRYLMLMQHCNRFTSCLKLTLAEESISSERLQRFHTLKKSSIN